MKIWNKIFATVMSLTKSVKRFPITIALSSVLSVLLIIFNESLSEMTTIQLDNFSRINMSVGLGILLSLCISLLIERFLNGNLLKSMISYIVGGLALLLYYYTLLPSFDFVPITRFVALLFVLIIGFFFIPWLKREHFELYVIKIFSSLLTTFIYSIVLYFGLSAILFTTNTLFDLDIDGKYYYYIFLLVGLVFAIALFLSKIPNREDEFVEYTYSKSLKVLLLYIVIPLISVYTFILYVYFAKILFTSEWPKGLVSHLVLWYSAVSVGIIFLITPILDNNPVGKLFKTWFPKVNIPILGMMFMSMSLRIHQYGITENRYYVIVLGIWVTFIMLYFSIVKILKNIIIPITLAITLLIAVFGPLSGYTFSIKSQNNRFEDILLENNMLDNGNVVKNTSLSNDEKKELSNIISYFENTHKLGDLKVLPDDFTISKMESTFGFVHAPDQGFQEQEYFFYNLDLSGKTILIDEYTYSIHISTWNDRTFSVDNLVFEYNSSSGELLITEEDRIVLQKDILEYATKIHKENSNKPLNDKELITSLEDMSFEEENKDLKVKFVFTSINGRDNPDTDDITLESADFILYLQRKQ